MNPTARSGALRRLVVTSAAVAWAGTPARGALVVDPGLYRLQDHPGHPASLPASGLRFDELFNVTSGRDRFVFSFDHPQSDMQMDVELVGTQYRIRIHGTAFGGLVRRGQFDPTITGPASIDFTYKLMRQVSNDDDLVAGMRGKRNRGTIVFQGKLFKMYDRAREGISFRLGDGRDDRGHHGFEGISGWGKLRFAPDSKRRTARWLFTATPVAVPAPGPVALLATAMLVAAGSRRRRT